MQTTDYGRIASAIEYLQAHRQAQPSLAELAAHIGLSESRTQRLFTAWAGISPKRFTQHLTALHSTALLRAGRSVLATAYASGLSGPARLHDLMVNVHAATPGEVSSGGASLRIGWGVHDSPFGAALIALTDRGICALHFLSPLTEQAALEDVRRRWPHASLGHSPDATRDVAGAVFRARSVPDVATSRAAPLALFVRGTNFQVQVWRALLRIPAGGVATYDDIARDIGAPTAHRAVGAAVGRNPVALLIPCHRVIRKSGDLGGYHWGEDRKRALLAWERGRVQAGTPV